MSANFEVGDRVQISMDTVGFDRFVFADSDFPKHLPLLFQGFIVGTAKIDRDGLITMALDEDLAPQDVRDIAENGLIGLSILLTGVKPIDN
jgi:hypothetical protein